MRPKFPIRLAALIICWTLSCNPAPVERTDGPASYRRDLDSILGGAARTGPEGYLDAVNTLQQLAYEAISSQDHRSYARISNTIGSLIETHESEPNRRRTAVPYYYRASKSCEVLSDTACIAGALASAARTLMRIGKDDSALHYFNAAAVYYRGLRDTVELYSTLNLIGEIYRKSGFWDYALRYYNDALELSTHQQNDSVSAGLHVKVGESLLYSIKPAGPFGAIANLRRAIELGYGPEPLQARVYLLLGLAHLRVSQESDSAYSYLRTGVGLARRHARHRELAEAYNGLGLLYLQTGQASAASQMADSAVQLCQRYGFGEILPRALRTRLQILLASRQQYDDVAALLRRITRLEDSLERVHNNDLVLRMHAAYENELKQLQFREMKLTVQMNERQNSNNRIIIWLTSACAVMGLGLAGLWFVNYRRKRSENRRLEDQVARRTEELDNFAYHTTHDIRGPVARIRGLWNLKANRESSSSALDYTALMNQEAILMDFMLRKFQDVYNMKNINPPVERISLLAFTGNVLENLRILPGYSRIRLILEIPGSLHIDTRKQLLEIILTYILDNAILLNAQEAIEAPYIRISARTDQQQLDLRIADNGIGIQPDIRPRIFDMFFRGTHRSSGAGLGLYAARQAAQKLGGQVTYVLSNAAETEFSVTLPLTPPEPAV
ncbi:MAG: ATP-binding protein [Bacteroidia bacterium]|nr:ATP-binding protein [Bacteroidia bacterium]